MEERRTFPHLALAAGISLFLIAISVALPAIVFAHASRDAAVRNLLSRPGGRGGVPTASYVEEYYHHPAGAPEALGGNELWDWTNDFATPWSVAIGGDHVMTCTAYDAPAAYMFDLLGGGTPLWNRSVAGVTCYVDASSDGTVMAMCYQDWNTKQAGFVKWSPGSSTPDWHYELPSNYSEICLMAVSQDGSRIAGVASSQQSIMVLCFDSTSPDPLWVYDENLWVTFPEACRISNDGGRILIADESLWVFDGATGEIIWDGPSAFAKGFSMSGDGNTLASAQFWGFSNKVVVRDWDGERYSERWSFTRPGLWLYDVVEISNDAGTLVVGGLNWNDLNHNELMVFDTQSSEPLWTLEYNGSGRIQDNIEWGAVTNDGSRFAIGYWGDKEHSHPEFMVFDSDFPAPIFAIDTPGSVYDVAISADGRYTAAASKECHANVPGVGGTVYVADLESHLAVNVSDYPLDPVSPGDTFTFDVEIRNDGLEGESFTRVALEATGPRDLKKTLYEGASVTLPGGGSVGDEILLKVPAIAPAGTYYLDIVAYDGEIYLARDGFELIVE